MKNIFKYILVILFTSTFLFGKEISKQNIFKFAKVWLTQNESFFHYGKYLNRDVNFILDSVTRIKDSNDNVLFYVAEIKPVGFILIASDDRLKPIIGYSSEHNFNYSKYSTDFFLKAISTDLLKKTSLMNKKNIIKKNSEWKNIFSSKPVDKSIKGANQIIGPFLVSDWGQGNVRGLPVFNYYSPHNWPTGCVATASAQILNFYKWPYQGHGSHSYYDNGQYLSADFGNTLYDWANTLDDYADVYFSLDNQKAAGLLVYHCAVALEMNFEYNGSTASTSDVPSEMHNYFRFSGNYKGVNSSGFWEAMKNNMLDERPAIISIKSTLHTVGHAAVVDGYFDTNGYYHCNPGWYGDYTGWYNISGNWQMETYDIVVGAAKGIVPSPQINEIERLTENSFNVSWRTSIHQKADYYELQQKRNLNGSWATLSNSIVDTVYQIINADQGSYYYRVRVSRDNIWWDYSVMKKVQLGSERSVTFQVDMSNNPLSADDTLVMRGNIPPLFGNVNSPPFQKIDSNNVYKLTLNFNYDYVGQTIIYRYFIQSKNNLIAENNNREYVLTSEPSQILSPVVFNDLVGVDDENIYTSNSFNLEQNYPNPFNPSTTINYSVGKNLNNTKIKIIVFNILGKKVAILVDKEQAQGKYSVTFETEGISSGIYFYRLIAGNNIITKKMLIIK